MWGAVILAMADVVKAASLLVMEQLLGGFGGKVITFPGSVLPRQVGGRDLHGLACTQLPEMYFSPGGADITAFFHFPLMIPTDHIHLL